MESEVFRQLGVKSGDQLPVLPCGNPMAIVLCDDFDAGAG
jgi:hypothetical protein